MTIRYARFHEEGEGRALIELAKQYHPRSAIREFVTNSLDARVANTTVDILLTINPGDKRIIISDNGIGMTYRELIERPESIGFSPKAGKIDARGEKALGLLAFGSLGEIMHIITRPYGDTSNKYYSLSWEIDQQKYKIPTNDKILTPEDVTHDFFGPFGHGTRIIIGRVPSHIFEKILTIKNLRDWLTLLYNPAIISGTANINIGRLDKRSRTINSEALFPIEYQRDSSSLLAKDIFTFNIRVRDKETGKWKEEPGNLEVLLYVDPKAAYDKVAVYSKDVMVYESIAELIEFSKSSVWTSGKVSGFINDRFTKLTLGREGIDRNTNAFKVWYDAVKKLEENIRPVVEEKKKHGERVREQSYIKEVFDAFADIWKDLKVTELETRLTRSKNGKIIPVIGLRPSAERGRKPGKPREQTDRPSGPGTFIQNDSGVPQRITPQRYGVPFGYPQPIQFPAQELHLRSKLEDLLGKSPSLFLNSAHEDYKSRVELKDPVYFRRYILDLIAKEASFYEIRKLQREGQLIGEPTEIVSATLRRAEEIKYLILKRLEIK